MLSYVIVGAGYRAEYFGRAARTYPELFRAVFLCRSAEKAALMKQRTGAEAVLSAQEAIRFGIDLAVIAVDRGHVADVAEEWIGRGYPVLTETPVASTMEQLERLRTLSRQGARIVSCEQYHRHPILAAGLRQVRSGRIGEPKSMYLSLLHDYHAASIIRRALMVGPEEKYTLTGMTSHSSAVLTDSRTGAVLDGSLTDEERTVALLSFASGKEAVYDFSPVQYRSYIRSRHLTVRGTRGEWSDTQVLYLDESGRPGRLALMPDIEEKYRCLDTQALRDRRRNWTAELAPDTVQDEFAVASFLLDMEAYLAGGESPYPFSESEADALLWFRLRALSEKAGS